MPKFIATFSLTLLALLFIIDPAFSANGCDQRLTSEQRSVYTLSARKVASKNKELYTNLVKILDRVPITIYQAPFETLVTPVNDYFWELYSFFRLEIIERLGDLKSLTKNQIFLNTLEDLIVKLTITEERKKNLIQIFEEHDYVQLGVLLNRRASDFPSPETTNLISYLDEIAGSVKGYLSEFVIALEQRNVQAISIELEEYLLSNYTEDIVQKIKSKAGEDLYNQVARLELDIVYEFNGRVFITEVKNSVKFANPKNRNFQSQKKDLVERAQKLHNFINSINNKMDMPFHLRHIFFGQGVAKELQDELKQLNIKVN